MSLILEKITDAGRIGARRGAETEDDQFGLLTKLNRLWFEGEL